MREKDRVSETRVNGRKVLLGVSVVGVVVWCRERQREEREKSLFFFFS